MAEAAEGWSRYIPYIGIVLSVLGFILGGGFVYNNLYHVADIRYTVLPMYNFPPYSFGGLVVENRGRKTAEDLCINLLFSPAVLREEAKITSDEAYPYTIDRGGKEDDDRIVIKLDRLTADCSIKAQFALTGTISVFKNPSITWKKGKAKSSSEGSQLESWSGFITLVSSVLSSVLVFTLGRIFKRS